MNSALPQEMEQHTYAIMNRVEDSHWWFVGRRAILESFLREITEKIKIENPRKKEPAFAWLLWCIENGKYFLPM